MKHPPMAKTELVNGGTPRVAPRRAPFQGIAIGFDMRKMHDAILRQVLKKRGIDYDTYIQATKHKALSNENN